jgi:thioredoxin reductase (NADPH)
VYQAESLVIATGAQARWLGIPGEKELSGFGVSACATCDGFFYRGKDVAVIGGGNSATEEALYLSNLARHVTLIHRRDSLRSEKILQQRLFAKANIGVVWNTAVEEVLADPSGRVPVARALALRNTSTGARSEMAVDGVFVAIGHDPATALFRGQVAMDADGYITTDPGTTRTSVPGVFAAGDVQDRVYRQAVTAAGTGCMAALEAEKFLAENEAHATLV